MGLSKRIDEDYENLVFEKVKDYVEKEFRLHAFDLVDLREEDSEKIIAYIVEKDEKEFMQLDILNYNEIKIKVAIWEGNLYLREDEIKL